MPVESRKYVAKTLPMGLNTQRHINKSCGLWNSYPDLGQEPNGFTLILVNFSHKETSCYENVSMGR